ncbi:MAG: SMI1/KNR4 family protein, partial [Psychroserpens sp.]|nr:SMI1/KNR4 family protein [Psychroserpens sp.]
RQKPRFAFEKNFLDWYERWLDEIISGDLMIDSPSWFGYTMGGTDDELIKLYQSSTNIDKKKEALSGILKKKEISHKTLELIERKYSIEQEDLAIPILQILTKFNYSRAKKHLRKEGERNLLSVFQFIFWYAKDKASEWKEYIEDNIIRIDDPETFRFCTYLIVEFKFDYGYLINDFIRSDNDEIRSTVIYTLGKLKNKEKYLDTFILGLSDSSNKVIHSSLQALSGVKNQKLLEYYKIIAEKFPVEKDYILSNLNHRLKEFNLSSSQIKNIDIDSFAENRFTLKEKKWYQIWK